MIAGAYFWATAYNSGAAPMSATAQFYARPEATSGNDHELDRDAGQGQPPPGLRGRRDDLPGPPRGHRPAPVRRHLWDASGFLGLTRTSSPRAPPVPGPRSRTMLIPATVSPWRTARSGITVDGRTVGHYDAPGFRPSSLSVYGEAYAEGKTLPQMSGSVQNYHTSTHSTLTAPAASRPYKITGHSSTGFSFK